ncbi:MAG: APC family permease [Hyphomicrobiales bacterium]|nr:APC family permease [Hyphomicrobiales bacterium]
MSKSTVTKSGTELPARAGLRRSVSLPLVTLYGLGTTIGAGIYVLVGATAAKAGLYAPLAFLIAAFVISFSAASFAELSGRFPVSAGEAAYVREGFGAGLLPLAVGLIVAASGIVSSAALVKGGAGYLTALIDLPVIVFVAVLPFLLGALAMWGIAESLKAAALLTLVEVGGLMIVIGGGGGAAVDTLADPSFVLPPFDADAVAGVIAAGLLAFFAFIGFEDIVNIAEEVKEPRRTLPWAIALTLLLTVVFYLLVSGIAVLTVPLGDLAEAPAPLALVLERSAGISGRMIAVIAVAAVLNGVLIQMVMASRVIYGLARMGNLPAAIGVVNPVTRTPVRATVLVTAIILFLALAVPLTRLAETTSTLILIVFSIVNLALWRIKIKDTQPVEGFTVPRWLPLVGFCVSVLFLLADLARRLIY